jgi:hypothetical protein
MRIARSLLLAIALAFVGSVAASTASMARSTNGCEDSEANDHEGSDHGSGHDAFCDGINDWGGGE